MANVFELREAASRAFQPDIISLHIQISISYYEDRISAASERSMCCCRDRLVAAGDIYEIDGKAYFILSLLGSLDNCGH